MTPTPGLRHSWELERELLGAYILDVNAHVRPEMERMVGAGDFSRASHAALWDFMRQVNAEEGVLDVAVVLERVGDRAEQFGGESYLLGLPSACMYIDGDLVTAKCRKLREYTVRRLLQVNLARLKDAADDPATSNADLATLTEQLLEPVSAAGLSRGGMVSIGDLMAREVLAIEDRVRGTATNDIVPTGWPTLDLLLSGGFRRKNLVIVAGRPAMGKSAVTLQMLLNMGHAGRGAGLFSIEMGGGEQAQRALSALARVPYSAIRQAEGLNAYDLDQLHRTAAVSATLPVWVDDRGDVSIGYIRSEIRRLKRKSPDLAIVAVDYLQRMQGGRRFASDSRATEVGQISRGLKTIAMEEDLVIVALAQLNRNLESRGVDDRRPLCSDLKESGDIEQDADVILFPYRHAVYVQDDPSIANDLELIVAKHRGGQLGTARARWTGSLQLVEDIAASAPGTATPAAPEPTTPATVGQIRGLINSLAVAYGLKRFDDSDYLKHLVGVDLHALDRAIGSFVASPPPKMPLPVQIGQRARSLAARHPTTPKAEVPY